MTDAAEAPKQEGASFPEATVVRRRRMRLSLVWIVPIAALVVGAVLIARTLLEAGPDITITIG